MDNKVIIYGLRTDGGAPPVITQIAVAVTQDGFLTSNLVLQGSSIFSMNPFSAEFNVDAAILDMVPVVNFSYLCGPATGTGATSIFGRAKYCSVESIVDPTSAQMVAELTSELLHNEPAENTAATVNASADVGQVVRIGGFGFTVTAVAAIAAPLLVTLVQDAGGAPVTLWSGRVLVPAGTSKEVWIDGPFFADVDATLTVPAPGATNFVTATIAVTTTGAAPS